MISPKQKLILAFPFTEYRALICDGAVRSGKTSIMMWAFADWAMRTFNGERFGICGKTVDSCTKNIIVPFTSMSLAKERYTMRWRRADKVLEIRRNGVTNYFEVFGGKDESSYALIQGRTLAGVLLDEVVLMPRSFVEQALTRCSVDGAKLWFSCNPDNPQHWFYTEWIQHAEEHNALYLHFEMIDNPGISEKTREMYETMFSGIFYDRCIRGKWVAAEGLIYTMFDKDKHIVPTVERPYTDYMISCDYGTLNPTAAELWGRCDGKWYCIREYYYDGRKQQRQRTDEEHYAAVEALAGDLPIRKIIVDPSAASFIEVIRRHGRFMVEQASNRVIDGIRDVATHLNAGDILFNDCCKDCISEFGLYRWDEKSAEDRPLKTNDHCLTGDTLVDTVDGAIPISKLVGKTGNVYCTDGETVQIGHFHNVRMTQENAEIYEINLNNGKTIKATADHPVLTKRGWVAVKDLRSNDVIACIDAHINYVGIQDIKKIGKAPVYNMEVEKYHNFSVNDGVIVHNCMDSTRYFVRAAFAPSRFSF